MLIKKLKDFYNNYVFAVAAIFATSFYLIFYLCNYMNYRNEWWRTGTVPIRQAAFYCCILALFRIIFSKKNIEMKLLYVYALWIVASRIALNDLIFLQVHEGNWMSVSSCWGIILCVFFGSGIYINDKVKNIFIKCIVTFLVVMLGIWALIALTTALVGQPLLETDNIYIETENSVPPLVFISFFGLHRNVSATFFTCAMGLALYQAFASKKDVWKVMALVFVPLSYVAVELQHSRSNYLTFSIVIALIAMIVIREKITDKSKIKQALICTLATLVCIVGIYASFSVTNKGIVQLSHVVHNVSKKIYKTSNNSSSKKRHIVKKRSLKYVYKYKSNLRGKVKIRREDIEDVEQSEEITVKEISDKRSTIKDSFTLTGRSAIWKATIDVLKENPKILIFGQPELKIMDKVNEKLPNPMSHTHNFLLQQLVFLGLPGLLIIVAFLFSLCRKIVLCFLFKERQKAKALNVLSALLLGLIVYGIFEPIFHQRIPFTSTLFFLMAGLFIAKYNKLKSDIVNKQYQSESYKDCDLED